MRHRVAVPAATAAGDADADADEFEYPGWVMLVKHDKGSYSAADAKTLATSLTSTGKPIRVSLRFDAPPSPSRLCVQVDDLPDDGHTVIAAHRDSILISAICGVSHDGWCNISDYFVYSAGGVAGDPSRRPSLSLLPLCYLTPQPQMEKDDDATSAPEMTCSIERPFSEDALGLLRRGGDGELLVAELKLEVANDDDDDEGSVVAELCVLRYGEWELKRLPVRCEEGEREQLAGWRSSVIVPIGERSLCWASCYSSRGVIICSDMWEESPELRYVPLPPSPLQLVNPSKYSIPSREPFSHTSESVCVTHGGATVKFVEVTPRCCCGGAGATLCPRSRHAFTIRTWSLLDTGENGAMAWNKDDGTTMDVGDELWRALPGYRGLPRVQPIHPTVSFADPDVLCLEVHEWNHRGNLAGVGDGGGTRWLVEVVNTRSKSKKNPTSAALLRDDKSYHCYSSSVPSEVSTYFNTSQSNKNTSIPRKHRRRRRRRQRRRSSSSLQTSSPGEILKALHEIPSLARDEILRAYSVLCRGNGCLFKCLLELPMDMRKEWLLMEIRNSEACSICAASIAGDSSCTKET